jgi:hypothetical protein
LISSRWANSLAPIGPIKSHDLPQRAQSRLRDGELRCEFSTRGGETWFLNSGVVMFCCIGLKNLIESAGQRGISVLVHERSGGFRFSLQSRAVSKEAEVLLSENPTPLPIKGNVTLSANIGLNFCPFCGTNLQTLVTPLTRGRFEALAVEHKRFDERPW